MPPEAAGDAGHVGTGELLDILPCGIVSFTDDGTVVLTNATLRELLGYPAGELEGRHVERLLTVAGRIFYQTHLFPLLRLHGRADEIFLLLRRKDGTEVGALANTTRGERGGDIVNTSVLLEVRERRKYEDELLRARRAAEQANAALVARTREVEAVNARLEQQAMELDLHHEELEAQAIEMEEQSERLQLANEALVARSQELEHARAVADDANRAKSQFLTTMSHELRTPLNAIGGYLQLMDLGIYGPVTDAQRDALERMDRSQKHLLRLINEVLNLARVEAGQVDYAVEDVGIAEAVASVTPMLQPQMAAARLAFVAPVPTGLTARADGEKVQQVLINLLTNAVKFTPAGGRVTVDAQRDDDGRHVLVRVSDTGIGIHEDKLGGIFEPFVQVEVTPSRRVEGTGLGLAISRDLARGMGGDLTVRSELGRGSVFTLSLPAGTESHGDGDRRAAAS